MKKIALPILALALAASAAAQVKQTWTNTLSDPMSPYEARDVTVAPNGVSYSISQYSGSLCRLSSYDGFGNRTWTSQLPVLSNSSMRVVSDHLSVPTAAIKSNDNKVHVIKLNPATGSVDWHVTIDEADKLVDFDVDAQGNVIVTFESMLDDCIQISKFSPVGAPLFRTSSGLPGHPARMTAVAANGQIYVGLTDSAKKNGILALTPNGTIRYIQSWENYFDQGGSYTPIYSYVICDRNGRAFAVEPDTANPHNIQFRTFAANGSWILQSFGHPDKGGSMVSVDSENRIVMAQILDGAQRGFALSWFTTSASGVSPFAASQVTFDNPFEWGMRELVSDSFGQTYLLGVQRNSTSDYTNSIWTFDPARPVPVWTVADPNGYSFYGQGQAAVGRWGQLAMTTTLTGYNFKEGVVGIKQMGFRNMLINGSSHTGGRTITGTANFYSSADTDRNVALQSNTPYATVGALTTTVVAGQSQSVFSVDLKPTAVRRAVRIDGTYNGTTRSVVFYLEPPVAASVTLFPTSVKGGMKANATARLNGDAPTGGINFALSSNNPKATVPASLIVPEGDISKGFQVNTTAVSQTTTATISATANSVTKTATLTITP